MNFLGWTMNKVHFQPSPLFNQSLLTKHKNLLEKWCMNAWKKLNTSDTHVLQLKLSENMSVLHIALIGERLGCFIWAILWLRTWTPHTLSPQTSPGPRSYSGEGGHWSLVRTTWPKCVDTVTTIMTTTAKDIWQPIRKSNWLVFIPVQWGREVM